MKIGGLIFYYNDEIIKIDNLSEFITKQVVLKNDEKSQIFIKIDQNKKKLEELKCEIKKDNEIYSKQEKQIVLFLECRKSFFKKISYFFKSNKKLTTTNKHFQENDNSKNNENKNINKIEENKKTVEMSTPTYTLADLVRVCLQTSSRESTLKNINADIKALELKQKNMKKKIENAKQYIEEIEKHKKSIFEFWKFSNKDELKALEEGEVNNSPNNVMKTSFNLDEEFNEFAQKADALQKRKLSIEESNAVFVCMNNISSINAIIEESGDISIERKDELEKIIFKQLENMKTNNRNNIITKIFGEMTDDYTTIKTLNDKKHRENKKNIYSILKINQNTTIEEYKAILKEQLKLINEAYNKIISITDMPVFYTDNNIIDDTYIIAEIDPNNLIKKEIIKDIYKINVDETTHILYFSNIIFYDNFNKTLPDGMDESSKVLIKQFKKSKDEIKTTKVEEEKNNEKVTTMNILVVKNQFEVENRKIRIIER